MQWRQAPADSYGFNKTFKHHFPASFIEINGQLIAINAVDRAIAKFHMKNPVAERKTRCRPARTRHHFAVNLCRLGHSRCGLAGTGLCCMIGGTAAIAAGLSGCLSR